MQARIQTSKENTMLKFANCLALLVLVPVFALTARAQDASESAESARSTEAAKPPAHYYQLDFVLEELDATGKPTNSRSFSTNVSTAGMRAGSFTVGSKVPIISGMPTSKDNPGGLSTQFQYVDIGVKFTARDVHEEGGHLALYLRAEVSSMAAPKVLNGVAEPVIRQNVWDGDLLIPIGRSTVAFKSDSLDDKGTMRLEVKATPIE
jgi:hypothetical protein